MAVRARWWLGSLQVVGCLLAVGYVGALMWAMNTQPYKTWGALIVIPALIAITIPMLLRAGRRDDDPHFVQLLLLAFALKAFATVLRYQMSFVWYGGATDAWDYHKIGAELAAAYRDGNFGADIGRPFIGTGAVRVFTGIVYTVTGPSIYVAFAVFALVGFWGLYFLYRAFRVGVPDGDARRYALLVLLLPSMLFWPSGLGKEALITFGIGLAAYGTARLLAGHRGWVVPLAIGLAVITCLRPHITAVLFTAIALAFLVRRPVRPRTELTPVVRLAGLVVLAGVGMYLISHAAQFLGLDEVSVSSVQQAISDSGARTTQGGSEFDPVIVNSPLDMPLAILTVLFRPFAFEAGSAPMLLAAAEGTLLLGMFAFGLRRLRQIPGRLRRQPYLVVCLAYTLLFVYAFSAFANFGILTRERVMVLPFALVFLALPDPKSRRGSTPSAPPPSAAADKELVR